MALFMTGTDGRESGSDDLREEARRRDMREAPSPKEWWILMMHTDSDSSEVLRLRSRWISQRGFDISNGVVVMLDTYC